MNKSLLLISFRSSTLKSNILCPVTYSKHISCLKSTEKKDQSSSDSSSSSSGDDQKQKSNKSKEALNKLNLLLKQMVEEDVTKTKEKINLARPTNKRIKKQDERSDEEKQKSKPLEVQMVDAVKSVSKSIGGDTKQTESELLMRLLTPPEDKPPTVSLSDIVKGMKIDREPKSTEQSRAAQVKKILEQVKPQSISDRLQRQARKPPIRTKTQPELVTEKIDLFGSPPLGIFTDSSKLKESTGNETWKALQERDLKLAVTTPPANYFQEMILWTEQGKLWKFPIDNEQGLEEEKKVYFADHVFLEQHLEGWCPEKGPIRHFMELVCVGLSKNPYVTVETKKEHIEWYRNYFEEKRKLLEEVGALPPQTTQPKQIES